ncbi:MAG: dihydroorotate dehydrogenase electron transfer subunit [bacterium]
MGVITRNLEQASGLYLLSVEFPENRQQPEPGQFYMLRCSPCTDPLLRRPLSIHGYCAEGERGNPRCDFLYRVAGKGTALLSRMGPADPLDVMGPLGTGFGLPPSLEYALLIAGGIGIAPLPYLAEILAEKNTSAHIRLLFGARTAEHIIAMERFKRPGIEISLYTEDGTMGRKGCVTDDLGTELNACDQERSKVFACGPDGMLAAVARQCISAGIPCQVSLDRHMACGVGACQGCVVKGTHQGHPEGGDYVRVCSDGPVFEAREILWSGGEQCPR